ncbi:MAG: class I SAM-dependent methyltransferase [Phycisphaerales bacterium]|nr:class I SAM-dependent methyltransferase [Phycisphaerales bacterium]
MPGSPGHPAYLKPYREAIARLGPGFEATLWRDRRAQVLRFDAAASLIDLDGCRLADLGCGPGDLLARLKEQGVTPADYLGVDAQPEMIELARSNDPGSRFEVVDLAVDLSAVASWKPDVCLISGTLNTMTQRQAWRVVMAAYDCSAVGVVFNFLSNRPHERYRGKDLRPARRFHTARWLDRCLRVTPCVSFRQEYLDGHDATIAMRRAGTGVDSSQ